MILLILNTVGKEKEVTTVFKFQYDSINTAKTLHSLVPDICFKFQYDSINTTPGKIAKKLTATLNSNMILLIPVVFPSSIIFCAL